MNLIAAVDSNWGLGFNGELLEHIPEDLKYFKEKTIGKTVVMGRTTLESFPGKKPLKDRVNIVLTREKSYSCEGVIVCHSLEELFAELKKYKLEEIFIAGGESVYTQLLPYCEFAYITKIHRSYEADKYLINLDKSSTWKVISESKRKIHKDLEFTFVVYKNIKTT